MAIVGPAFLDALLYDTLIEFMVDDPKEVQKLLQPDGPLGTCGSRITACYCLGLIGPIITSDLRMANLHRVRFYPIARLARVFIISGCTKRACTTVLQAVGVL